MALNNPYALSFDGVDDYVQVANDSILNPTNITLETWIKPTNFSGYKKIISKLNTSRNGFVYGLQFTNTTLDFFIQTSTIVKANFNHVFAVGELIHIAATYDGNMIKMYVNGMLDNSQSHSGVLNSSTNDVGIGCYVSYDGGHHFYSGYMDEIRVWNYARTQSEIKYYMNKRLTGNESGLVAYYHCDEGEGTALIDSSPNGNDGTIHGTSYVDGEIDLKSNYLDVVTLAPTDLTYDSMTLNGELKKVVNYPTVDCKFQYSTNPEFGKLNDINNLYALSFDGVDDYVNIGNLNISGNWTVEFFTINNDVSKIVCYPIGLGGSQGIGIGGTLNQSFFLYDGTNIIKDGPSVIEGREYHIAVTKNETNYEIFVNGTSVVTGTLTDISITDLNLGKRSDNFSYYNGILDEIRFWSCVRTQEEIQNYQNKRLKGNEPGLVAYYRCDESTGNTLVDATGNGNDGTINGASYVPGEVQLDFVDNVLGVQETEPQTIKDTVLSFDGVDDYVEIPNLNLETGSATIELAFEPKKLTNDSRLLSNIDSTDSQTSKSFTLRFYSGYLQTWTANWATIAPMSIDSIYWLSIVFANLGSSDQTLFYINGELVLTQTATYRLLKMGLAHPLQYSSGTVGTFAQIHADEFRAWNRMLSQEEIQDNMNTQLTGNESGLIAYYKCDEGEGTTLIDSSPNGNDGTIYGATYTESPDNLILPVQFSETLTGLDNSKPYYYRAVATTAGESLDNYNPYELFFDGNSYVNTPLTGGYNACTISFKIKPNAVTDNMAIIQKKSSSYDIDLWGFSFLNNKIRFLNEYASDVYATLTSTTDILADNYYNITVTADGKEGKLYIDGELEDSLESSHFIDAVWANSEIIRIGIDYKDTSDRYYNGVIDEIRIFDKVLTQSEIQANLNRRLVGTENGLVAYYRCDNVGHEKVLIDNSGNDEHGTIYGATWVSKY